MNEEKEEETKVLVGGRLITLKTLKQKYADITIADTPGNFKVIETLEKTDKPLTRHDMAKITNMTPSYVASILKKLIEKQYITKFRIGRSKILYYLLTEKGYNLSKTLEPRKSIE